MRVDYLIPETCNTTFFLHWTVLATPSSCRASHQRQCACMAELERPWRTMRGHRHTLQPARVQLWPASEKVEKWKDTCKAASEWWRWQDSRQIQRWGRCWGWSKCNERRAISHYNWMKWMWWTPDAIDWHANDLTIHAANPWMHSTQYVFIILLIDLVE